MRNVKRMMAVLVAVFALGLLTGCRETVKPRLAKTDTEYLMYVSHEDCSACQSIAAQVNQYKAKSDADTNDSLINLYKLDLKYVEYTDTVEDFGVRATPTLMYIKEGIIYKKAEGTDEVLRLLEKHYGKL